MNRKRKQLIIVYTDGSCSNNGSKDAVGGIGIHFPNGELDDVSNIYTGDYCTNQKTELGAIVYAIIYVNKHIGLGNVKLLIKTDSQYSIDCVTKWVPGWIDNGWITKTGKPVSNREFIEKIYEYYTRFDIGFEHVEAHTGDDDPDSLGNQLANDLAMEATKKALVRKQKTSFNKREKDDEQYYIQPRQKVQVKLVGIDD